MTFDLWKPAAGLVLFLLAMSLIEEAIRILAGARVKSFITRSTQSRWRGVFSGTIATAILQSSSLVGLLVLAFVGARVMPLRNALLIIFGANLGTTATGWIVATIGFKLDLESMGLPLIALGGFAWILSSERRLGISGRLTMGIGLLLLALQYMKAALGDVESNVDPQLLAGLHPVQFLLFGVVFSAVVQSSSAAMVVTLSALSAGVVDVQSAAAVMIGADLGTTSTVVFGAINGSANKKRVALGHVLFNVVTDAIAFVLLVPLVRIASLMEDPLLTLVAFHSLFNLIGVVIWVPFVSRFAAFLERRFLAQGRHANQYLDESAQLLPEAAIPALLAESRRLSDRVVTQNMSIAAAQTDKDLETARDAFLPEYKTTKRLEGEILEFALDLDVSDYDENQRLQLQRLLASARNLLVCAKLMKDSIPDLLDTASRYPDLFDALQTMQKRFYDAVQASTPPNGWLDDAAIATLNTRAHELHESLHTRIHGDIKEDRVNPYEISAVLNVNRGLFNSNSALTSALTDLQKTHAGHPESAAPLSPIPEEVAAA